MAKTKTSGFFFKATPEEMAWIERRMAESGIKNKSAFLRKMAIDGHVFNLDSAELGEIAKLLRITANNVNQVARRANSGGNVYRNDVAEVNAQLTEIRVLFGDVLTAIAAIADAKPGKRFTPPLKYSDLAEFAEGA